MASQATEDDEEGGVQTVANGTFVVPVGKVRYAVGLFWNDVGDASQAAAEARKVAARPGVNADLFCVRGNANQYGLGKKADGHAKQMPSLAGHLADSRGGSWLGAFAVADGYYFIAVQDDEILDDLFFEGEVDARNKFDDRLSSADWADLYAPDDFGVDGAKDASVASLLTGKPPRLQDIDRVGSIVKYGGFALVVLALVGGVGYYMKSQNEAEQAAMLAELQRKAAMAMPGQQQKVQAPPAPWEGKYKAASYLEACRAAMAKAMIDIPGWQSKSLVCSGGTQVSMSIERMAELGKGGGTINWVRWALDRGGMKDAVANMPVGSGAGNSVLVTWDFADRPEKWKPADVKASPKGPTLESIHRYLLSQFEEMFTSPTFQSPTGDVPNAGAPQQGFYRSQKFSFKTQYEPSSFLKILDRVDGLVISKVTLDLKDLTYAVEGQSNEQLPLPVQPGAPRPPAPPAPSPVASR